MEKYTQTTRKLQVTTPLGPDALLLQHFSGKEGISELFRYDLLMLSENRKISYDALLGKNATVKLVYGDGEEKFVNGIISSFMQGGYSGRLASYKATLVPWLWLLSCASDCRIFQKMKAPDILKKIFSEYNFSDYKLNLHGNFREREYCVQYRETTLNFITRIMQDEGISYFFEHTPEKHTLVLADGPGHFPPCPNEHLARYRTPGGSGGRIEGMVSELNIGQEVRPGSLEINDFFFEKPAQNLTVSLDGPDPLKYQIYDYPGEYTTLDEGEELIKVRMEEELTRRIQASGSSTCESFTSGYTFDLVEHYRDDLNRTYLLTHVYHEVEELSYETGGNSNEPCRYFNRFTCVPHPTPYRPGRTVPVPVVQGTQTAIVVGPPDEEIYVDKFGRVKVQFHWDRRGKYNEQSSCWVRVSQNWAGKRWGTFFIPRIGQEVIVDFIEGNPDRPIIIGSVYNGSSLPPYPDEKTKSTIKTLSSKGGDGYNEIRFEDKKGQEQIFIHAEKDQDTRIKNDEMEWVGRDSHRVVKHDAFEKVEGDCHLRTKGDKNEEVEGTVSLNAGMDLQEKVGMKYGLSAGTEVHLKAGMNLIFEAGVSITLKAGGAFIVVGPTAVAISGLPVLLNSGGTAGSGSGCSPQLPKDPKDADDDTPGQLISLPKPKKPPKATTYSPAALALKKAAATGKPFCAICQNDNKPVAGEADKQIGKEDVVPNVDYKGRPYTPAQKQRIKELGEDPDKGFLLEEGEAGLAAEELHGLKLKRYAGTALEFVDEERKEYLDVVLPMSIGKDGKPAFKLEIILKSVKKHLLKGNIIPDFGRLDANDAAILKKAIENLTDEEKRGRKMYIVRHGE